MNTRFYLNIVILYGVTVLLFLFVFLPSLSQFVPIVKDTNKSSSLFLPAEPKINLMTASDTFVLSNDEQRYVRHVLSREVSFDNKNRTYSTCPNRYFFVGLRGFGRHHNQLQMLMNSILWAERVNRTAVLGWFYAKKSNWVYHNLLYDFSEIMKHYCVVTADEMMSRMSKDGPLKKFFTAASYGVIVGNNPIKSYIRKMIYTLKPGLRHIVNQPVQKGIIQCCGLNSLLEAPETLVVVSPEFMFFMRHGLADHAAIYRLLRPSAKVSALLTKFMKHTFPPGTKYFAVHKRHREGSCFREMTMAIHKTQAVYRVKLDSARQKQILSQCKIDVSYLEALYKAFGLQLFSYPLFIAHDGQDPEGMKSLVARGARVYEEGHYPFFEDCHRGLCALAVDYFVMVEGEYYTGNVLSSISQDVCFARLGRGRACHAMEPSIMRIMSHDVLKPYPDSL